jgi:hypothetical protein
MSPNSSHFSRAALLGALLLAGSGCGPGNVEAGAVADEDLASTESPLLFGALAGQTIRATESVYFRTGPSTSNSVIRLINAGEQATVVSESPSNGFYQINVGGTVGWSHGDYWELVPRLYVNGYLLSPNQEKWLRWVAAKTVPRLTGTRDERLDKASRVSWWAMKEGVWDLGYNRPNPTSNPQSWSSCYYAPNNVDLWPLETCNNGGGAWQVGLAGIQVNPNSRTVASLESTAVMLYPGSNATDILAHTARTAGFPTGSTEHTSIVNSTGNLRKSWLLRNHGVGFHLQDQTVYSECVVGGYSWCYGSGHTWYPANRYASSRTAMNNSIYNIRQHLNNLAP